MIKITEIIPDDLPEWAVEAMENGQLFNEMRSRIIKAENALMVARKQFYYGTKIISEYFDNT